MGTRRLPGWSTNCSERPKQCKRWTRGPVQSSRLKTDHSTVPPLWQNSHRAGHRRRVGSYIPCGGQCHCCLIASWCLLLKRKGALHGRPPTGTVPALLRRGRRDCTTPISLPEIGDARSHERLIQHKPGVSAHGGIPGHTIRLWRVLSTWIKSSDRALAAIVLACCSPLRLSSRCSGSPWCLIHRIHS